MAVSEWDQRQLCADGGCIGVIGSEGTCKVCGRAAPNWGDERMRGLIAPSPDPDDEDGEYDDEDDADDDEDDADDEDGAGDGADGEREDKPRHAAASAGGPAWTARALCPDGSCIGVIGPDGRCKACGKPAAVAASPSTAEAASPSTAEPTSPGDAMAPGAAATAGAALGAATSAATDREPCTDASCTGLIGADGRCEVCGKGAS